MSDVVDESWVGRLKKMISKILLNIIDEEDIEYYFTEDAIKIWILAFTNETYSPSDNNEDLEYLGDIVLKSVFPKYLMRRFPNLHKNDYTELNTRYMSKIDQGKLAYQMGFETENLKNKQLHMIRTKGVDIITINLVADAFEAFFGALDTISDNIKDGLGYANCYNLIKYLFDKKEITDAGSHAKTQIQQLFTRFELPKPLEKSDEGKEIQIKFTPKMNLILTQNKIKASDLLSVANEKKEAYKQAIFTLQKLGLIKINEITQSNKNKDKQVFDVILTRNHLNFLRGYGISLDNTTIGHGEAPTKKDAESKAYSSALDFLNKIRVEAVPEGITTAWAERTKLLSDVSHPNVSIYLKPVAIKLSSDDFVSFEFKTPAKTSEKKTALMQLIGIRADGKKDVLASTKVDQKDRKNGNIAARAILMKTYLDSK